MAELAKVIKQEVQNIRDSLYSNPEHICLGDFVFFGFWEFVLSGRGKKGHIGKVIDLYDDKGVLFAEIMQLTELNGCRSISHKQLPVKDLKRLDPLKASVIIANKSNRRNV